MVKEREVSHLRALSPNALHHVMLCMPSDVISCHDVMSFHSFIHPFITKIYTLQGLFKVTTQKCSQPQHGRKEEL